jgi:hypothetical protein
MEDSYQAYSQFDSKTMVLTCIVDLYLWWVMEMNKSVIRLSTQISNSSCDINLLNLHRTLELWLLREFYHIELVKPEQRKRKTNRSRVLYITHSTWVIWTSLQYLIIASDLLFVRELLMYKCSPYWQFFNKNKSKCIIADTQNDWIEANHQHVHERSVPSSLSKFCLNTKVVFTDCDSTSLYTNWDVHQTWCFCKVSQKQIFQDVP